MTGDNKCGVQGLPHGWCEARINDLIGQRGIFIDGDWVESKDQDPNGEVRLIQLADIGDGVYRNKSARFLTDEKAIELRCTFLREGDVLVARMPDPLGRCCIFPHAPQSCVTVVDVCIVRFGDSEIIPRWFMYATNSPEFRAMIADLQSGSTRKRISRGNLATLKLPVPPLPEQARIVARIEELLSQIDAGAAGLRDVQKKLKRYRASVLKAACEGTLVPTEAALAAQENRAFEPAGDLLARILTERWVRWEADQLEKMRAAGKEPKDDKWKARYEEPAAPDTSGLPKLPEGWAWASFMQVADIRLGKMLSPKAAAHGLTMLPYLRNENVRWGTVDLSDVKTMGFSETEIERFRVKDGDLLVCEGGEPGRCSIYKGTAETMMYQKALHRVRPTGNILDSIFLQIVLTFLVQSKRFMPRMSETTIQHLPLEKFVRMPVPLSPLAEQERIVAEVERRLSVVDQMEAALTANLKRANRLRQAVLRDAFAGKLVPQDPTDEPAAALLERIRAAREDAATTQARPARKKEAAPRPARSERANETIKLPL